MPGFLRVALDLFKHKFLAEEDVGEIEIHQQKAFDRSIEIEFGNLSSLSGFKPYEDRITNRIGTSQIEILGVIVGILWKYLRRVGTWIVLLHASIGMIIWSSNKQWTQQYFSTSFGDLILLYMVPAICSLIVFSMREFNLAYQKLENDQAINNQKCTIFKPLKKTKSTSQFFKQDSINNNNNNNNNNNSYVNINNIHNNNNEFSRRLPDVGRRSFKQDLSGSQQIQMSPQRNNGIEIDDNQDNFGKKIAKLQYNLSPITSEHADLISLDAISPRGNVQLNTNSANTNPVEGVNENILNTATPINKQNPDHKNAGVTINMPADGSPNQRDALNFPLKNRFINKLKEDMLKRAGTMSFNKQITGSIGNSAMTKSMGMTLIQGRPSSIVPRLAKLLEETTWGNLEIGNIVLLRRGEAVPADLLILETRQDHCTVDQSLLNGKTETVKKFPSQLTAASSQSKLKSSLFEYRKMLSCRVEFSKQQRRKDFSGFIKMSKDPKGENLDQSNIICRGTVLGYSEYAVGLVIAAGEDCRIFLQCGSRETNKDSFFQRKARMFFLVAYFLQFLSAMGSTLVAMFSPCSEMPPSIAEKKSFLGIFISFLLEYLHILPQVFYIAVDVLQWLDDVYQNKAFLKANSLSSSSNRNQFDPTTKSLMLRIPQQIQQRLNQTYQLLRSVNVGDISLSNFVFMEKTGVLTASTNQDFEIRAIVLPGRIYAVDSGNIKAIGNRLKSNTFNHQKSIKEMADHFFNVPNEGMDERISQNYQPSYPQALALQSAISAPAVLVAQAIQSTINQVPDSRQCSFIQPVSTPSSVPQQQQMNASASPQMAMSERIFHLFKQEQNFDDGEIKTPEIRKSSFHDKRMRTPSGTFLSEIPSPNASFLNNDYSMNIRQSKISDSIQSGHHRSGMKKEQVKSVTTFDENDFFSNLWNEDDRLHHEAMLALVICNQVTSAFDQEKDQVITTHATKEAKSVTAFAELFQYSLKCASVFKGQVLSPNYIVNIHGNLVSYKILAINEPTVNRQFFSILFRDPNSLNPNAGSVLFAKISLKNGEIPNQIVFKDKEERARMERQITSMLQKGMRSILYCKRELDDERTDAYLRAFESLKRNLVQEDSKIQQLFESIEVDLSIVCVIGVLEKLREGAAEAVSSMRLAGLRPWMLTGDSHIQALSASYQVRIIDPEATCLHLESDNHDQIKMLIRDQLNSIQRENKLNRLIQQNPQGYKHYLTTLWSKDSSSARKSSDEITSKQQNQQPNSNIPFTPTQYYPKKISTSSGAASAQMIGMNSPLSPFRMVQMDSYNQMRKKSMSSNIMNNLVQPYVFSVQVSGKALTTIFSDTYLRDHFQFLAYFCSSLIAYDLQPHQKLWIVRMVKNKYPQNPKTLAIGATFSDIDMMRASDISIQMQSKDDHCSDTNDQPHQRGDSKMIFMGDIIVSNFKSVQSLLYSDSRLMAEIYEELLLFTFYRSFLAGFIIMFYNISSCSFGESLWDGLQMFLFHSLIYIVSIASYLRKKHASRFKHPNETEVLVEQFASNAKTFKKQKTVVFFYKVVLHSFAEAVIIFMIMYVGLSSGTSDKGKTFTFRALQIIGFFTVSFTSTVKMLVISQQNLKESICTVILFCIACVIYIPLHDSYLQYPFAFTELKEQLFTTFYVMLTMLSVMLFVYVLDVALEATLYIPSFFAQTLIRSVEKFHRILERQDYLSQNKLRIEGSKINNILSILLPKFVRDRITETGQIQLCENQGEVGVLFCDICDFDRILSSEGERIVLLLDSFFRSFDFLCNTNECTKIETVGKTYVAASGLTLEQTVSNNLRKKMTTFNAVERLINLAFDMQDYVKNISWGKDGEKMKVRIGIHFGKVIAGVIGSHKPQFSLIGDTINTTSRVMSTGEDNRITISQSAHAKIQPHNATSFVMLRKDVEAKGKGVMVTYQMQKVSNRSVRATAVKKAAESSAFKMASRNKSPTKNSQYLGNNNSPTKRDKSEEIGQSKGKQKFSLQPIQIVNSIAVNNALKGAIGTTTTKKQVKTLRPPQQGVVGVGASPAITAITATTGPFNESTNISSSNKQHASTGRPSVMLNTEMMNDILANVKKNAGGIQKPRHSNEIPSGGELLHLDSIKIPRLQRSSMILNTISRMEQQVKEEVHVDSMYRNIFSDEVDTELINELFNGNSEDEKGDRESGQYVRLKRSQLYLSLDGSSENVARFYQEQFLESKSWVDIKILGFSLLQVLQSFLSLLLTSSDYFVIIIILHWVYTFLLFVGYWTRNRYWYASLKHFQIGSYTAMMFGMTIVAIETILIKKSTLSQMTLHMLIRMQTAEVFIVFIVFSSLPCMGFRLSILLFCGLLIAWLSAINDDDQMTLEIAYFLCIVGATHLVYHFLLFKLQIKNFNNLKCLFKKTKEQNSILSNLLPKHVLDKFLNNPETTRLELADKFEDVTILFADIAGFTKYSSEVDADQVVSMLRNLFDEFDKVCVDNDVFKLYTIGDCYVAIGFTDIRKRNPADEALRVVQTGFAMIEIINEMRAQAKFQHLDMRIGVHTGQIIGGVIGTDIVRYDIYGRDVVIANKMESSGEQGRILVSSVTREYLEPMDIFNFTGDKLVHCKSVDVTMAASFVEYSQGDDSSSSKFHDTTSQFEGESNAEDKQSEQQAAEDGSSDINQQAAVEGEMIDDGDDLQVGGGQPQEYYQNTKRINDDIPMTSNRSAEQQGYNDERNMILLSSRSIAEKFSMQLSSIPKEPNNLRKTAEEESEDSIFRLKSVSGTPSRLAEPMLPIPIQNSDINPLQF